MMVSPGLRIPCFSASSTIRSAMRSLTEPPALKNSHLASSSHLRPAVLLILLILTRGVLPMWCRISGIIFSLTFNFSREWGQSSGLLSILQVHRLGRSGRTKGMGSFIKLIFLPRRQGMGAMGGTWLELILLLLASAAPRAFAGVLLLLVTVAAAIA